MLTILDDDEPGAFEVVNPDGKADMALLCDHASNRVPRRLGSLGLLPAQLLSHIAWDPGAAMVARELSRLIDAPLILSGYSRLVIDCNRPPSRDDSIPLRSDDIEILANANLTPQEREARRVELLESYHLAIKHLLDARRQRTRFLVSIHSFTPLLQSQRRPWSIGVCYGADDRFARLMLTELIASVSGAVGDNEPYSIEYDVDYTLPRHGDGRSLPNLMLEIRQDLIATMRDAKAWAHILASAWSQLDLEAMRLRVEHHDPGR